MTKPKPITTRQPLSEDDVAARAFGLQIPHRYRPSARTEAFVRRIRRVATELYAERGLNGVSLADVSRVANLGPTLLQYYYGKREHLLYDILSEHVDTLLKTAQDAVTRNQDTGDGPAWTQDLILALLRDIAGPERDGHRVLRHTLHVLPAVQRDSLEYRLGFLRVALAQPIALAAGLDWLDPRLDPLARAVLATIGDAATWFPRDHDAAPEASLHAHAALLTAMALHGAHTSRDATAPAPQPGRPGTRGSQEPAAMGV